MNNSLYDKNFFVQRMEKTQRSAEIIVPIIINLFHPSSVIDYGCANGIWLSEFIKLGVDDILGVDANMHDRDLLVIPEEKFLVHDLEEPFLPERSYDIAISLEVAEHLKAEMSTVLIESLTNSSNIVVFSAAIPNQGGVNHINEQWPEYWAEKFLERGFVPLDLIRNRIWNNKSIPVWYKQNILCYINKSNNDIPTSNYLKGDLSRGSILSIVHPDLYSQKTNKIQQLEKKINKKTPLTVIKKAIYEFRKKNKN